MQRLITPFGSHSTAAEVADGVDLAGKRVVITGGAAGQSKSAAALLSVGITQNWVGDGILSNALNPGAIATGLQKHTGGAENPGRASKDA